jgi:hypothetical protein
MTDQPKWHHTDSDWAVVLESDFKTFMDACYLESLDDEDFENVALDWENDVDGFLENFMPPASTVTATGYYFCGCRNCETREYISFLIPRIIQGYLDGKLKLEE